MTFRHVANSNLQEGLGLHERFNFQFSGLDGSRACYTMLKWTCRLRDLIESKGYKTCERAVKRCTEIREAEFVDGNLPEQFRWETFKNCCEHKDNVYVWLFNCDSVTSPIGQLVPAINSCSPELLHIRSLCGLPITSVQERKLDVLWLSQTVFVSWTAFSFEQRSLRDFEVEFIAYRGFSCYVYSLSAFGEGEWVSSSSALAMHFFRHLIGLLPANYFRVIRLCCLDKSKQFPLEDFLSMVPHDAPLPPLHSDTQWTKFHLSLEPRSINQDELRAIFSHKFHPLVKLSFNDRVFDQSVPFNVFSDLLRQARHLRAVALPSRLMWAGQPPALSFKSVALKSQGLTAILANDISEISPALLHSFSTQHQVNEIRMEFHHNRWEKAAKRAQLHGCIKPLFQRNSRLEHLTIQFAEEDFHHVPLESIVSMCLSQSMCFFSASSKIRGIDRNLDRVQYWDQTVFPQLSLNYWRNHVGKPVAKVSLVVKAINQGLIYRKTTDHIPYNSKIAHAGIIFYLIKDGAKKHWQNSCMTSLGV
jgi:hypothetical protein